MFNLRDRIDIILRVTVGAVSLIGCHFVISPVRPPLGLAAILTGVSGPFYQGLTDKLKGHSTLSAGLMVSLMFVTVLIPLSIACTILARQIPEVFALVREWIQAGMPLPQWLVSVPYIGHALEDTLQFGIDPAEIRAFLEKSLDPLTKWLWSLSWGVGNGLFQLILVAFIAFFFYRDGHTLSDRTVQFINRMSGGLAAEFTDILVKTTRSVVFGVIGTAIGQGLVAAVGFWIAGVPSIAVLSSLVCILSVVPVGPPLVWGPVALWLYATGNLGMALFLVLWGTLAVSSVDNFLKPILISRGTSMPLALVFLGVFGGILSFGFLGLVLGPILLAATLALFKAWVTNNPAITRQIARNAKKAKQPLAPMMTTQKPTD